MTSTEIIRISGEMMKMVIMIAGPIVLAGMVVGLVVSIFQTITQIQEQSLGFVVKIAASLGTFFFMAPWMIRKLSDFTAHFLGNLDKFAK
jgi:flagellar biosynthesis protein FliQ